MKMTPLVSLSLNYQDCLGNSIAIGLKLPKKNPSIIERKKNPHCSGRKCPLTLKQLSLAIVDKVEY